MDSKTPKAQPATNQDSEDLDIRHDYKVAITKVNTVFNRLFHVVGNAIYCALVLLVVLWVSQQHNVALSMLPQQYHIAVSGVYFVLLPFIAYLLAHKLLFRQPESQSINTLSLKSYLTSGYGVGCIVFYSFVVFVTPEQTLLHVLAQSDFLTATSEDETLLLFMCTVSVATVGVSRHYFIQYLVNGRGASDLCTNMIGKNQTKNITSALYGLELAFWCFGFAVLLCASDISFSVMWGAFVSAPLMSTCFYMANEYTKVYEYVKFDCTLKD